MPSAESWANLAQKVDETYALMATVFGEDHPVVKQLVAISDNVAEGTEAAARREHPEWFE